jgi:uncharacterized membrane protein YhhN
MSQIFSIGDGVDGIRLGLVGASALASLVYLRFAGQPSSPSRAWLKTFCFASLAVLPMTYLGAGVAPTGLLCLAGALALSALGDWFLAATDQQRFFVPGLASFLLAHVVFVITFLPLASAPGVPQLIAIGLALGASGMLMSRLLPKLGKLTVPVIAYFLVINSMICMAVSASAAGWVLGAGAILFAFSDSLIAVRKFLSPFPGIHEAVWATYAVAQFMICLSVLEALLTLR